MSETTQFERSIPQSPLAMVEVSCTQGDQGLYEKLYRECYAQAYSRATWLGLCHEDAEDAVQATFCEVWKHWSHLEPRGLHNYVLTAVSRKAIDFRRRQKYAISIEANEVEVCVSWDVDTMLDLATAREALSEEQRNVVRLREEGYSREQIQKLTGLTPEQLGKRLWHARIQLRKAVAA